MQVSRFSSSGLVVGGSEIKHTIIFIVIRKLLSHIICSQWLSTTRTQAPMQSYYYGDVFCDDWQESSTPRALSSYDIWDIYVLCKINLYEMKNKKKKVQKKKEKGKEKEG